MCLLGIYSSLLSDILFELLPDTCLSNIEIGSLCDIPCDKDFGDLFRLYAEISSGSLFGILPLILSDIYVPTVNSFSDKYSDILFFFLETDLPLHRDMT